MATSPGWSLNPQTLRAWAGESTTTTIRNYSTYSSLTYSISTSPNTISASRNGDTVTVSNTAVGYGSVTVSTAATSTYNAKTQFAYLSSYGKPTTATGLSYTGSAQQLLTSAPTYSGSASYSYAVSTTSAEPSSGWATDYTSATGVGSASEDTTYYVHVKTTDMMGGYVGYVTVVIEGTISPQTWTLSNGSVQKGSTKNVSTLISGTTYGTLTYSSSNTSIFTVNSSGVITGVAGGSTTLTVTASGNTSYSPLTRTSTITVTLPSPGWSLSPTTIRAWVGDNAVTTIQSYSTYSSLTWSTSIASGTISRSGATVTMGASAAGYTFATVSTAANTNYAAKSASCYLYWYTKPGVKTGLVYTGSDQQLLSSAAAYSQSTTFGYAVSTSTTIPTSGWNSAYTSAVATGSSTSNTTYYVHVRDDGPLGSGAYIGYVTVSIAGLPEATWTTTPSAKTDLVYTGSAQVLGNTGTTSGGTPKYKLSTSGTYSNTMPSATNAGTYTVEYYIAAGSGYRDGGSGSFQVTISKKTQSVSLPNTTEQSLDWTGSAQSPTYTPSGTGFTTSGTTSATAIGNYTITYTLKTDSNITYKWSDNTTAAKTKTWHIVKATNNITVTSPFSQVWYSSSTYNPTQYVGTSGTTCQITATCKYGTISYSSSDTSVATVSSSGLMTFVDAGTATITLSVTGNSNYYGVSGEIALTVQNTSNMKVYSSGWKTADPYVYYNNAWRRAVPYVYTSNGWKKA